MLFPECGTAQHHPPAKLSKPPTNTSSNLLAPARQGPEAASPLTASDDSGDGYFTNIPANEERKERPNTRSRIRSYLYGPSPESGHSHSSDDEENSPRRLADVARNVKRRLSRTDSAKSPSLTVGGASAASSTSRLHMADTSSADLDEHDVIKEQIKEKVWIDTLAAQNHVSTPIDEDKHPDSVKSPIRRRSLYTPGIATRSPEDILRKPPPPELVRSQADRDYYYNPALPVSSPLSQLANLRSPQTGRSTPSELDYSHLGALKPGTLRVTNGTASPAPCEQDTNAAPTPALDSVSYGGSYEPSESGRSEPEGYLTMSDLIGNTSYGSQDNSCSTVASQAETTTDTATRSLYISPGTGLHSRRGSGARSFVSVQSLNPSHVSIKRKPLPPSFAGQSERSLHGTARPCEGSCPDRNIPLHRKIGIETFEYKDLGPLCSQERQSDSWKTLIRGADLLHPNQGSTDDAFLKLTKNESVKDESGIATDTYQYTLHETASENQHADSGYSSNVSLESTHIPTSEAALGSATPLNTAAYMQSPSPRLLQNHQGFGLAWYTQGAEGCREDMEPTSTTHLASDKQKKPFASAEIERHSLGIDPEHLALQKQLPAPEKPRRLQKKRPKSQPPLHRTPMLVDSVPSSSDIPPVPTGMATLHSNRMSQLPSPNHNHSNFQHVDAHKMPKGLASDITQTRFPSPTHGSEDALQRDRPSIFQKLASKARSRSRSRPRIAQSPCCSDDESAKSIMRSPSWSEYGNKEKTELRKKKKAERELRKQMKRESAGDANVKSRSKSRSRSRFRSRSRNRSSQGEPIQTLTDFGTVSESLGASPYDIAVASRTTEQQSQRRQLQPYQIGTTKHGLHSEAAVSQSHPERGRCRSSTSATVPLNQNMSVSACVTPKLERPRSMYCYQKPVPAMSMTDLTQRKSVTPNDTDQQTGQNARMVVQSQQATCRTKAGCEAVAHSVFESKNQSQSTSNNFSTVAETDIMEKLIDKLLEAPNHEAKEIILEQIRQVRRKSSEKSKNASQEANTKTKNSLQEDAGVALHQTASPMDASRSQPCAVGARVPKATKPTGNAPGRHQSISVDAPPMPPLHTAEDTQQQDAAHRSMERIDRKNPLITPLPPASQPTKTDLWAGCAIQTEHRKAIESSSEWDAHRLAWSRRRKSAGEALLASSRASDVLFQSCSGEDASEAGRPPTVSRAMTAGSEQPPVPKESRKAFHRPWARTQTSEGQSTGPLQTSSQVAATAQTFERRSGRYEGGLLFGYEKGFGLGGSAGTRSTKTGATRKSLQISQGFGVDLSDVPIFVAPSK
ncbi:MAG: hypothetical protein Q9213_000904 [Squamulea squamosa]